MRKIFALLMFFSLNFPSSSFAVIDPFSWALAGSVALHSSVAGLIARFRTQNGAVKPTSDGGASMAANAVWVELVGLTPTLKTQNEVTALTYPQFNELYSTNVASPLYAAFNNVPAVPGSVRLNPANGSKYSLSTSYSVCASSMYPNGFSPDYHYINNVSSTDCRAYDITLTTAPLTDLTVTSKTKAQTISALPALFATTSVKNAVVADLTTMTITSQLVAGGDYTSSSMPQVETYQLASNPNNAVTVAQQTQAETAKTQLAAYNVAAADYTAINTGTHGATHLAALDAARGAYNGTINALNSSLGASGVAPAGNPISDITTKPVDPGGASPSEDPAATNYGTAVIPSFGNYSGSHFSFGNRFQSFFNSMRTTSVFSIPGQFVEAIPTGGSSTMSFNGGKFGTHTFDFASFSNVFIFIRSLFLVACSWVAVRIITKGGGS